MYALLCNILCWTAIRYYRKAVQLVPDIEFKIDEFRPIRRGNYIVFCMLELCVHI